MNERCRCPAEGAAHRVCCKSFCRHSGNGDHARPCSYAAGSRSSVWNPQSCKIVQRLYVQNFKTGISLSQNENADALDKQLFCIYRWRCPAGSSKTVYRKPENIAETKG